MRRWARDSGEVDGPSRGAIAAAAPGAAAIG